MRYVAQVCAFERISENIYFHCSNDKPVNLHYSLDEKDSSESENYVRFFIAPKICDN